MKFVALREQYHDGHLYVPGEPLEVPNDQGEKLKDTKGFDKAFRAVGGRPPKDEKKE